MSVIRIASRYAKSLLDFAQEQGLTDVVLADIQGFSKAVENRDLYLLLKSPVVKPTKKAEIFKALFEGKLSKTTMTFFNIIIRKGREMFLPEIAQEFEVLHKKANHISTVEITTASELGDEALSDITSKLLASNITDEKLEFTKSVNPEILGGFIVKIGDKLYDASVKSKLDNLRKEFSDNDFVSKL